MVLTSEEAKEPQGTLVQTLSSSSALGREIENRIQSVCVLHLDDFGKMESWDKPLERKKE